MSEITTTKLTVTDEPVMVAPSSHYRRGIEIQVVTEGGTVYRGGPTVVADGETQGRAVTDAAEHGLYTDLAVWLVAAEGESVDVVVTELPT